jgi:hypothetical protein
MALHSSMARVEVVIGQRVGGGDAEDFVACGEELVAAFYHFFSVAAARVAVDEDLVAGLTAQQAIGRHIERLAGQVPQRDVNAGQCRLEHRAAAPECAAEDILPDVLDAGGVLADEQGRQVVESVGDGHVAARERGFAEAVEAVFGGDFDVGELAHGEDIDGGDFHGAPPLGVAGRIGNMWGLGQQVHPQAGLR